MSEAPSPHSPLSGLPPVRSVFAGLCVAIPAAIIAHYLEGRILAGFRRVDDVVAGLLPAFESFEGRSRSGGNGRPADTSAGGGKV